MSNSNLAIVISAKNEADAALKSVSDKIEGLGKSAEKGGEGLHGFGEHVNGVIESLGALGMANFGIGAIGEVVRGFFEHSDEAAQAQAQLNAVLESTHGVAGETAAAVNELSKSLSEQTLFSKEAVTGAQSMLLTFTSIGKTVFPEATETVLNMSQALGQDLKSSAIQLGKALNDPLKGMTALQRVGVQFTEDQKKQIKAMMDSGNQIGAQKLILGELNREFGNSAVAAGETLPGKLAILGHQFDEIKEIVGNQVVGAFTDLVNAVFPTVKQFAEDLPGAFHTAEDAVGRFLTPARDAIQSFLQYLNPSNTFDLMASWFGPEFGPKIDAVTRSIKGLIDDVARFGGTLGAIVSQGLSTGNLGGMLDNLKLLFGQLFSDLGRDYPKYLSSLGNLGLEIANYIGNQVSKIDWGQVWSNVKNFGAGLINSAVDIGGAIYKWVSDAVGKIDWKGIWDGATGLVTSAVAAVRAFDWTAAAMAVRDAYNQTLGKIDWGSVGQTIATMVSKATAAVDWPTAMDTAKATAMAVDGFLTSVQKQDFSPIGESIGRAIGNAIKSFFGGAGGGNASLSEVALAAAVWLAILPYRLIATTYKLGADIVKGIVMGLAETLGPSISAEITRILQSIHVTVGPFTVSAAGVSIDTGTVQGSIGTGGASVSAAGQTVNIGSGGVTIHQTFNGATDPAAVSGASRHGVQSALRAVGAG